MAVAVSKSIKTESVAWFLTKVFLATGGLFAFFTGAFDIATKGRASNLLFRFLFFGAFMSVVLGLMHLRRSRRPGIRGAVCVTQAATTSVRAPMQEVLRLVRSALAGVGASETRFCGGEAPAISAKSPMTFRSWGEKIEVAFHPSADGSVDVHVQSRPRFRPTLCDYGKNLDNVERIVDALAPKVRGTERVS